MVSIDWKTTSTYLTKGFNSPSLPQNSVWKRILFVLFLVKCPIDRKEVLWSMIQGICLGVLTLKISNDQKSGGPLGPTSNWRLFGHSSHVKELQKWTYPTRPMRSQHSELLTNQRPQIFFVKDDARTEEEELLLLVCWDIFGTIFDSEQLSGGSFIRLSAICFCHETLLYTLYSTRILILLVCSLPIISTHNILYTLCGTYLQLALLPRLPVWPQTYND